MTSPRPVALVTGAGAGIGRACAITLASQGHHVVVSDRDERGAESTTRHIRDHGGLAEAHMCDVSDSSAVDAMIDLINRQHGALDAAVNNAGISGARVGIAELDDDAWMQTRSIDLDGVLYCMRAEIRAMRKQGRGSIVNMASILSTIAVANAAAYVTAKHGVLGLTRSAALDYAQDGIRINAVGPGFIDVERRNDMPADVRRDLTARHPIGRLGSPGDVAELVAFLISERAQNITGSFFPTDGGYTVH